MVTESLTWGQTQQLAWIRQMNRDLSRWVVVGDLLDSGAESRTTLESAIEHLISSYELNSWVLADDAGGETVLLRSPFDVMIEWTNLRCSPQWAVRVVHSRFMHGKYSLDVYLRPLRLFGYEREDGRHAVVGAVSHLFADGAGMKGLARALSKCIEPGALPLEVASLSDVVAVQEAIAGKNSRRGSHENQAFEKYFATFDWERLNTREAGELVVHRATRLSSQGSTLTGTGELVGALGVAWRHCLAASPDSVVPVTVLHRHPSPIPGRPYMGPGDVSVMVGIPPLSPESDATFALNFWQSMIQQTRALATSAPSPIGTPDWDIEQERLSRTLRLNVRANVQELARDLGDPRFEVSSTQSTERLRAFADVAYGDGRLRIKWDLPRAAEATSEKSTFGHLAISALNSIEQKPNA